MIRDESGSLGFKLISVSIGLTAIAAIIVGVVVAKMSEDSTKERLHKEALRMSEAASTVLAENRAPEEIGKALLAVKLEGAGSSWIIDSAGKLVGTSDPRLINGDEKFGETIIELTAVSQPLAQIGEKKVGNKLPLNEIVGLYESGFGTIKLDKYTGENKIAAFVSVPDKGWLVGVDEPLAGAASASSNIKRYILIACLVLGFGIIFSTGVSISFIIKPFYRAQMELLQKVAAANKNLKMLHEVSLGMQKHLDLDERIQDILKAAREVVGLDRIFIFMPDAEGEFLQCRGAVGNEDEPEDDLRVSAGPDGGAVARAYRYRETIRVTGGNVPESLRLAPPYSEFKALRSREFVAIPLIVEDSCVGVVAADNQLSKIPISKEKIAGIELFINQAAVAIQNANMYEKLRVHADYLKVTDHLTSTYNFDHFKELLTSAMEESRQGGLSIMLGIITVGNFGNYNRLSGHRNGDSVLSVMASRLKERVGPRNIVGRCFGSTFSILLIGQEEKDAMAILNETVEGLRAMEFPKEWLLDEKKLIFLSALLPYNPDLHQTIDDYMHATIEKARSKAVEV